jgi:hypothetical protein
MVDKYTKTVHGGITTIVFFYGIPSTTLKIVKKTPGEQDTSPPDKIYKDVRAEMLIDLNMFLREGFEIKEYPFE